MKRVSLIIIAMVLFSSVQAQYKLRVDEIDEFEGTVKKFTSYVKMGKTSTGSRVTASVSRIDETIFVNFTVYVDLGCISQYRSTAHLKFVDGTVLEMYSLSDTDCGDDGTFTFVMVEGDLRRDELKTWTDDEIAEEKVRVHNIFLTKRLEKIKFSGTEYYTVLEVDPERQDAFTHMLNLVK